MLQHKVHLLDIICQGCIILMVAAGVFHINLLLICVTLQCVVSFQPYHWPMSTAACYLMLGGQCKWYPKLVLFAVWPYTKSTVTFTKMILFISIIIKVLPLWHRLHIKLCHFNLDRYIREWSFNTGRGWGWGKFGVVKPFCDLGEGGLNFCYRPWN